MSNTRFYYACFTCHFYGIKESAMKQSPFIRRSSRDFTFLSYFGPTKVLLGSSTSPQWDLTPLDKISFGIYFLTVMAGLFIVLRSIYLGHPRAFFYFFYLFTWALIGYFIFLMVVLFPRIPFSLFPNQLFKVGLVVNVIVAWGGWLASLMLKEKRMAWWMFVYLTISVGLIVIVESMAPNIFAA